MSALRAGAQVFRPTSPQNLLISNEQANEKAFVDYLNKELVRYKPVQEHVQHCTQLLQNINALLSITYHQKSDFAFGCGMGSMTRHYLTISISENLFNPTSHGYLISLIERIQRKVDADLLAQYGWTILKLRASMKAPETVEVSWGSRELHPSSSHRSAEECIPAQEILYTLLCRLNAKPEGAETQCEITFFLDDRFFEIHIGNTGRINDVKRALFRHARTMLGDNAVFRHVCDIHVLPRSKGLCQDMRPLTMLLRDMQHIVGNIEACNFCNIISNHALLVEYEGHKVCSACMIDDQMLARGINSALFRGPLKVPPRIGAAWGISSSVSQVGDETDIYPERYLIGGVPLKQPLQYENPQESEIPLSIAYRHFRESRKFPVSRICGDHDKKDWTPSKLNQLMAESL